MNFPSKVIAGDTLTWRDFSGIDTLGASVDSGSYDMKYALRGPTAAAGVDLVGAAFGTGWQTSLSAAQSAALNTSSAPLTWYWQAVATKRVGGNVVTLGTGTLQVLPSLANQAAGAATFDGRSQAEKDLAAVKAAISARINGDAVVEYTIGGRSLKKEPMASLVLIEQRCGRIVARERRAQMIANGMGNPGRVSVRFTRG